MARTGRDANERRAFVPLGAMAGQGNPSQARRLVPPPAAQRSSEVFFHIRALIRLIPIDSLSVAIALFQPRGCLFHEGLVRSNRGGLPAVKPKQIGERHRPPRVP